MVTITGTKSYVDIISDNRQGRFGGELGSKAFYADIDDFQWINIGNKFDDTSKICLILDALEANHEHDFRISFPFNKTSELVSVMQSVPGLMGKIYQSGEECFKWEFPNGITLKGDHNAETNDWHVIVTYQNNGKEVQITNIHSDDEKIFELLIDIQAGRTFFITKNCLDMDFAVKVYDPVFVSAEEQLEGEKRFFREAKMLFSLNNTHIARIYDAGRMDGKPYIRMEYIKGYTVEELRNREGNMSFSRSAIVISHILAGLKHAHEQGVIHRDLRPRNVIFSESERMFKIIDFGISAFLDTENHTQLTKTGEHIAGGSFIDPILQQNPKIRDVRSDIYSVGAIWYFLLCGRAPSGSDMKEYLEKSNSQVTPEDIDIIMKCLSTSIENRYSSCEELLPIVKKAAMG